MYSVKYQVFALMMDEKLWKAWWSKKTFLLPPAYGGHDHVWKNITAGVAGCELCGIVHACSMKQCNPVPCVCVLTDDSSSVCDLTGIVVNPAMLTDNTVSVEAYNKNKSNINGPQNFNKPTIHSDLQDNMERFVRHVEQMVHVLIYSPKAENCRAGAHLWTPFMLEVHIFILAMLCSRVFQVYTQNPGLYDAICTQSSPHF